jgi:uncharacterized membrane protein
MDFFNFFFIFLSTTGISFFVLGYFFAKNPPKEINFIYGYRTKRSMASQEQWDFAQKYSAKEMMNHGKYMMLLSLLGLFLQPGETFSIICAVALISLSCILLIVNTEKKLKQKFKNNETLQRDTEV